MKENKREKPKNIFVSGIKTILIVLIAIGGVMGTVSYIERRIEMYPKEQAYEEFSNQVRELNDTLKKEIESYLSEHQEEFGYEAFAVEIILLDDDGKYGANVTVRLTAALNEEQRGNIQAGLSAWAVKLVEGEQPILDQVPQFSLILQ